MPTTDVLSAGIDLVKALAWPVTAIAIALLFRKELRERIGALKELKYPGGSITLQVERLEARVAVRQGQLSRGVSQPRVLDPVVEESEDARVALATIRVEVDRELFNVLRVYDLRETAFTSRAADALRGLESEAVVSQPLASDVRDFISLSEQALAKAEAPQTLQRALAVGARLLAELRKIRNVRRAEVALSMMHLHDARLRNGEGNGTSDRLKHVMMAHVVSILPNLDHDYLIYKVAMEHLRAESMSYEDKTGPYSGKVPPGWHTRAILLTQDDFLKCLEVRRQELLRLVRAWEEEDIDSHLALRKANVLRWPLAWGELEWSVPVVRREDPHISDVEEDLFRTHAAIDAMASGSCT